MIDSTDETATIDRSGQPENDMLLPLLYQELRRLAAMRLSRESPTLTLQPTALVHEAWLRLVQSSPDVQWSSRGHFFAAAAEAMRRILVERARRRRSLKRGGRLSRVDMTDVADATAIPTIDLLALDEALDRLEQLDQRKAALVKLRFYGGQTVMEAAEVLGISTTTAENDWAYARSWLRLELQGRNS